MVTPDPALISSMPKVLSRPNLSSDLIPKIFPSSVPKIPREKRPATGAPPLKSTGKNPGIMALATCIEDLNALVILESRELNI